MVPIFLLALTVHEIAHALTANWGGDLTATYQNRLSLNPLVHMDPVGTVLVPILSIISNIPMFGWAKPVPVDEAHFRDKTWNIVVAMAGPFSNLLLALAGTLLFSLIARVMVIGGIHGWWSFSASVVHSFWMGAIFYVSINWLLCLFNLIPVPPLDGSHVVYHFFIRGHAARYGAWDSYRRFGIFILLMLLWATPVIRLLSVAVFGLSELTLQSLGLNAALDQALRLAT